ncbi:hypothetical protein GCM10009838_83350 [Catenulispora subtropica]|uniref:Uncharacterized protein n=2 Tax=Catenulispora subtropica TaxID=450798 RepID=A0ABN2TCN3_9ACTN
MLVLVVQQAERRLIGQVRAPRRRRTEAGERESTWRAASAVTHAGRSLLISDAASMASKTSWDSSSEAAITSSMAGLPEAMSAAMAARTASGVSGRPKTASRTRGL